MLSLRSHLVYEKQHESISRIQLDKRPGTSSSIEIPSVDIDQFNHSVQAKEVIPSTQKWYCQVTELDPNQNSSQ